MNAPHYPMPNEAAFLNQSCLYCGGSGRTRGDEEMGSYDEPCPVCQPYDQDADQ